MERIELCLLHTNGLRRFASLFFDVCSSFRTALVESTNHYPLLAPRISLFPLNYEIITSTDLYPMNERRGRGVAVLGFRHAMTRQVRAASDESSPRGARRCRLYLRLEEGPPPAPRPAPPAQHSHRRPQVRAPRGAACVRRTPAAAPWPASSAAATLCHQLSARPWLRFQSATPSRRHGAARKSRSKGRRYGDAARAGGR
ncbi:hypothetical protein LEMLEM_LOCUS24351 [Lemmus lemmus]